MYNGNYEVASLVYICICMFKNDISPCGNNHTDLFHRHPVTGPWSGLII